MPHFNSGVQTGEHRLIRAIRAIIYALTEDTPAAWAGAALVLNTRLTGAERAAIARAVAGTPPETTSRHTKPMSVANTWARRADERIRNAVAAAAFRAMSPEERQRFIAWTISQTEEHDNVR